MAAKRLLAIIPVLLGVSIVIFSLVQLMPGDVAEVMLGAGATAAALEKLRATLHLSDPLYLQYFRWLSGFLKGDFGMSVSLSIPVKDIVIPRLVNTAILTVGALIVSVIVGLFGGLLAAFKQYSLFDRLVVLFAVIGASIPVFWFGLVLMSFFSYQLGLLPAMGMYSITGTPTWSDLIWHMLLPVFTVAAVPMAVIARLVRSDMIEVLQQEYTTALKAKGLSQFKILFLHGLRNILPSTLNVVGMQIGYVLGGAVLTEVVFSWPGLGLLIYDAIIARDMPLVQASVLIVGFIFVFVNAITDLIVMIIDPKLRVKGGRQLT